jgi:catechol 2,3-dioxygenase-like lactoylglutathione lyase family enzyme
MAEKACHAVGSATQVGLTQALAPMKGISHITFIVRDLERMSTLLCKGLGAREVYDSAGRNHSLSREKFFVLGGVWLAAMEGEPPAERSYQHVAFAVNESDLPVHQVNLQSLGVEVRQPRSRVDGEGQSLYFYDFDNHLFELHTGTLEQRLVAYGVGR